MKNRQIRPPSTARLPIPVQVVDTIARNAPVAHRTHRFALAAPLKNAFMDARQLAAEWMIEDSALLRRQSLIERLNSGFSGLQSLEPGRQELLHSIKPV